MEVVKNVCVYCGHHNGNPIYEEAATKLGEELGQKGLTLVYGGGKLGLMGLCATAALQNGGYVIGYIPEYLDEFEGAHPGIQELHRVDTMHTRKLHMFEKSHAFVVLPGGFGTLDEFFEVITWKQLFLHAKPIVIVNINGYWDKLIDLMHHVIDTKFALPDHRHIFQVAESVEQVVPLLSSISSTSTAPESTIPLNQFV